MNPVGVERMREAAARALITERCRRAYLHDVRGGLQAIAGAFEVLARLARSGDRDSGLVEKVSTMARRALKQHEHAMEEMVKQMTSEEDASGPVDVAQLIDDALKFLRNDMASRQISINLSRPATLVIEVQKHRLQLILLGLIAQRIDDCPNGAELTARITQTDGNALIEFCSATMPQPAQEPSLFSPRQLVEDTARQWLIERGGRLEERHGTAGRSELAIFYPLPA